MIVMRLDRMLADRKVTSKELAERIGISPVNISRIKTGKINAIRFSTLEAICEVLRCQPGDLLEFIPDAEVASVLGIAAPHTEAARVQATGLVVEGPEAEGTATGVVHGDAAGPSADIGLAGA